MVVRAGREAEVAAVFARYDLHAVRIGMVIDEPVVRCRAGGEVVCEVPGRGAGRRGATVRPAAGAAGRARGPAARRSRGRSARRHRRTGDLLDLLASPNGRSRKPIWRRYDHMNGTNTLVAPGAGDAALLRVKGTTRAIAIAMDGPSPARLGALDPRLAAVSAVCEAAVNVACSGARADRSHELPEPRLTGVARGLLAASPRSSAASPTRARRSAFRSSPATSASTTRRRTDRSCPRR